MSGVAFVAPAEEVLRVGPELELWVAPRRGTVQYRRHPDQAWRHAPPVLLLRLSRAMQREIRRRLGVTTQEGR